MNKYWRIVLATALAAGMGYAYAPLEIIDILLAEDIRDGFELDAFASRYERLTDIRQRIDEIESERFKQHDSGLQPSDFVLEAVYPNPFNSTTRINFTVPDAGLVQIAVFDMNGREIASTERWFAAGRHTAVWRAEEHAAGTYLLRASALGVSKTKKVVLVK